MKTLYSKSGSFSSSSSFYLLQIYPFHRWTSSLKLKNKKEKRNNHHNKKWVLSIFFSFPWLSDPSLPKLLNISPIMCLWPFYWLTCFKSFLRWLLCHLMVAFCSSIKSHALFYFVMSSRKLLQSIAIIIILISWVS